MDQIGHHEKMPDAPEPIKYLWVLRHGKAVQDAPQGGGDKERPLTGRGRRDATAFGHRLAAGNGAFGLSGVPLPDLAVCSTATRTRETVGLVLKAMEAELPLHLIPSLYGANSTTALQLLQEFDDQSVSALIVGHNPTLYQVAWELLAPTDEDDDDRSTLRNHGFPTCALAVLRLHVATWEDVGNECGSLAGVFSPPY